jgi:hypothetical protein
LSPRTPPGHPDRLQQPDELWAVTPLTGGDDDRQWPLSLLTHQMDFCRQSAARPAESMIGRLGRPIVGITTRRFFLPCAITACSGRVLMRPADGGIDVHLPVDQPGRIRSGLQGRDEHGPHPSPLPTAKQPINRLPWPVPRRQIPPRRTRADPPANPIDQLPPRPHHRTATPGHLRQQRLQHSPLLIGQISTTHTKIITGSSHMEINF